MLLLNADSDIVDRRTVFDVHIGPRVVIEIHKHA